MIVTCLPRGWVNFPISVFNPGPELGLSCLETGFQRFIAVSLVNILIFPRHDIAAESLNVVSRVVLYVERR